MTESILTQEESERIVNEAIEKSTQLIQTNPFVAQMILKQLLRAIPNYPKALELLGLCAHKMGSHVEAIEIIKTAIELNPENADNYNNIALALACAGNPEKAIEYLEKAIELRPENFLFMNNLALQYKQMGDYERAIELLERSLSIKKTSQILTNLGGVYGELHKIDRAMEYFEEAVKLDPESAATHVDLAYGHHLKGEWDEGFKEYEWRFDHFPQLQHYKEIYDQDKKWDGKKDLNKKTILLYGEQGLGDMIMFARYIPQLKKAGAKVVLHCSPVLRSMFDRCDYIDATVVRDVVENKGEEFPEYDYQCSTMSLPYLLGSYETSNEPYLKAIKDLKEESPAKTYPKTFNIGIVWAGSPAHPRDYHRSVPLKHFKPLYELEGVKLFSLQLDTRKRIYKYHDKPVDLSEGAEDMTEIVDLSPMIENFDDTAFFLSNLDLLITVDTAILHLAGALGIPTLALIQNYPDWRWKISGDTTHWYPSVKLFREEKPNDWENTLKRVKNEVENLLSNK